MLLNKNNEIVEEHRLQNSLKTAVFFLLLFPVHMLSDLAMLVQFSTFSKCFIHLTYFLPL